MGYLVCPSCDSRGGSFCECQSVANDPSLSREWHLDNPSARGVAKSSRGRYLWLCPNGHPPYTTSCNNRCSQNHGCPICGDEKKGSTRHPLISVGRPDLAKEWDTRRNTRSPIEVTLGSRYVASWICSRNPEHPPWQTSVQTRALRGCGCPACIPQNRFKARTFGPSYDGGF